MQDDKENRNRVPDQDNGNEQAGVDIVRCQVDDQQLHGKQKRDNDDTDFHKPCQPCPLVEPNVPHLRLFLRRYAIDTPVIPGGHVSITFYPASLAIIENSGRYREITIPPTATP